MKLTISKLMSARRLPAFIMQKVLARPLNTFPPVIEIVEEKDWINKRTGYDLKKKFEKRGIVCHVDELPIFHYGSIIHFGSINSFTEKKARYTDRSNILVATMFHGNYGISKGMDDNINRIRANHHLLDAVIVSTSEMKNRMLKWDIPSSKLHLIPLGLDLGLFKDAKKFTKKDLRLKYNIPQDAFCIGSFQKDGNDWGEGLTPKLIKGPDIFVDVVSRIHRQRPVHVLLSGPARGYVMKGLAEKKVPYTHVYAQDFNQLPELYRCLDLYMVTSREEGGPLALLEAPAAEVPLLTTNVGMAPDILNHEHNALIVPVEDREALLQAALRLMNEKDLTAKIINNANKMVLNYDWDQLIDQYINLYKTLVSARASKNR